MALNNDGDEITLYDELSVAVDYVAWESFDPAWPITAASGDSIERIDPSFDTDLVDDWQLTSPATLRGGFETSGPICTDGVCEAGEDCVSCAEDCIGVTGGKPSRRCCLAAAARPSRSCLAGSSTGS